jgi:hypothetical protein
MWAFASEVEAAVSVVKNWWAMAASAAYFLLSPIIDDGKIKNLRA